MARLASCILYQNASAAQLDRLLAAFEQANIGLKTIWANGPLEPDMVAWCQQRGAVILGDGNNVGIAKALNQFCDWAIEGGAQWGVAFDQDSLMSPESLRNLETEFAALNRPGEKLWAAIGPQLIDERTGQPMAQFAPYRLTRVPLRADGLADHLITSAMLFDLTAYTAVGPFNESYFVDFIDIEWCLRARALGYRLKVANAAQLQQSIGGATKRIFGRSVYSHKPERNFFQVRNAIWLMRFAPIGLPRKLNEAVHLVLRIFHILLLGDQRSQRLKKIIKGIVCGLQPHKP